MTRSTLLILILASTLACYRPMDIQKNPVPPNTLILEFASPVNYVMDLHIDGKSVPIQFAGKNRLLYVEGLEPGVHTFTIDSISYVFGPEHHEFEVNTGKGSYFFVQGRKYRSALPKDRAQVSIRAYRRGIKKGEIKADDENSKIRAYFVGSPKKISTVVKQEMAAPAAPPTEDSSTQ